MISSRNLPKKPVECTCKQIPEAERTCKCDWAEFCWKNCDDGCCRYYYPKDFDPLGHEIATGPDLCERCDADIFGVKP